MNITFSNYSENGRTVIRCITVVRHIKEDLCKLYRYLLTQKILLPNYLVSFYVPFIEKLNRRKSLRSVVIWILMEDTPKRLDVFGM